MANTYTQIHIHAIFGVQNRISLIREKWKVDLYKYITSIIQDYDHKLLIINGTSDHLHILFGMRPTQSLSDLMKEVKEYSSKWVNNNRLVYGKFNWQAGFGAFSYTKNQVSDVITYIKNQQQHHRKKLFSEEYKELLEEFGVSYDERYIFKEPE